MPIPSNGRKSRKTRKQLWIVALAGSTLACGLFLGNAIDANLLAVAAGNTNTLDEGWKPFQNHLEELSSRSVWLGLAFLVLSGFALPRAHRVARRYFARVNAFRTKQAAILLAALLLLGGVIGFLGGSIIDRILTAIDLVR